MQARALENLGSEISLGYKAVEKRKECKMQRRKDVDKERGVKGQGKNVSHYFYSERPVVKELQGTILREMNCAVNVGCSNDKDFRKMLVYELLKI